MTTPLAGISLALEAQWARLSAWLEPLGNEGALAGMRDSPSVLPGWTVQDLIAHVARAMSALTDVEPIGDGTQPIALAEYLGHYPERAQEIARSTREMAHQIAGAPLQELRERVGLALVRLRDLGTDDDAVIGARRGALTLRDLAASRLIELVVHTDDLVRSLDGVLDSRGPADPLDPGALRIVADELCAIVTARGGGALLVRKPRLWIRLATGRVPLNVDDLAIALESPYTASSVPDLGRMLPLF